MSIDYERSSELISPNEAILVVVDVQQKLLPHIFNQATVESNVGRLIDGAAAFGIPVIATEQYPKGLGPTVDSLCERIPDRIEKITFSCVNCEDFRTQLTAAGRRKVLVCGIESHICVLQTALDLLSDGYAVFTVLDAIGARQESDHDTAIRRLESCGVIPTTTEMVLFEWCEKAGTETFKAIQKLVI